MIPVIGALGAAVALALAAPAEAQQRQYEYQQPQMQQQQMPQQQMRQQQMRQQQAQQQARQARQRQEARQQQGRQQQARQQQEARKGIVSASGRIIGMRQVRTQQGDVHRLVKLETTGGNQVVVDLGSARQRIAGLQQGDQVFVTGRAGRINQQPIIVARYFGELQQVGQFGDGQQQAARGQQRGGGQAAAGGTRNQYR